MEDILLPTTIEFLAGENANVGKVVITPCHQGYGTTLGNALRRVLLSSLPGAAVESVKISGVQHEFSAIEGVQEDMIAVILNLKQLAVRCFSEQPVVLSLRKKGRRTVTAADFEKNADVEIVNPELKIFTITGEKTAVDMEIVIGRGRGYQPAEEKDAKNLDLGTILIDSLYTPIRDVGYNVEMTRVGDITDYEKLTLNLETNGTIAPKEAIQQATKILMDHFALILEATDNGVVGIKEKELEEVADAEAEKEESEKTENKVEKQKEEKTEKRASRSSTAKTSGGRDKKKSKK